MYSYIRGSALSFAMNNHPELLTRYTVGLRDLVPESFGSMKFAHRITQNFSAGVYISPSGVCDLLSDLDKRVVREALTSNRVFFERGIVILRRVLEYAASMECGLLEATDVIEPNPMAFRESNFHSCDPANLNMDGIVYYADIVSEQLEALKNREGSQ